MRVTLFLVALAVAVEAATVTSLFVNGKRLHSLPHTLNSVVYVPVFPVCRALGRHAAYDPHHHQVVLEGHPVKATVRIWEDQVYLPALALAQAAHAAITVDRAHGRVSLAAKPHPVVASRPTPPASLGHGHPGAPPPVTVPPLSVTVPNTPPALVLAPGSPPMAAPNPAEIIPQATPTPGIVPTNVPWTVPVDWPPKNLPTTKWPGQDGGGVARPPPDVRSEPPLARAPIVDAPPDMGPAPPVPVPVQTPIPLAPTAPLPVAYQPRTGSNGVFAVTVTNVERIPSYHSHYQPRAGYQFIMVSLSEQNISTMAQVYTGRFALQDTAGNTFEVEDGLSNFWPIVLSPQGTNFGYLTFEIPVNTAPLRLLLNAEAGPPVSVALQ